MTRRDGSMDQPRRRAPSAAIITTLVVTLSLIWLLLPAVAFADNCVGKDEVKRCAQLAWDSGFFQIAGALFAIAWGLGVIERKGAPSKRGIPPDQDDEEGDGDEGTGARPRSPIPPDEHEEEQDGFEDGERGEEE